MGNRVMDLSKPKTLVFLLLALLIVLLLFGSTSVKLFLSHVQGFGMNKTIGWAWDFAGNWSSLLVVLTLLLYFLAYSILWILGMNINKVMSVFNLIFLALLPAAWAYEFMKFEWALTLLAATGVLLSMTVNIIFAIRYKLTQA